MLDAPDPDRVRQRLRELAPYVRATPTLALEAGTLSPGPMTLKLELHQVTGSFKARGAFATLLDAEVPAAGVVGASGGNFGLALAHAARVLGHVATVFVPSTSPAEKIDGLRRLGADVRVVDGHYPEALAASEEHVARTGALRTHAYDAEGMVLGSATLGAEIEAQHGCPDVLYVAVGGGGLVAGLASWFRDRCRIVAVEPEGCPTLHAALQAGAPVEAGVGGLAASSLGARVIGERCWAARQWIDHSVLIDDDQIRRAQHDLWRHARVVAEPGGAAALAGAQAATDDHGDVVVLVCGANVDPATVVAQ